ncbi:MAG: GTP pyrophosphokinase family protein [Oscillospiraceae bacterium]
MLYARNPIHHIESRVKSPESIMAKLLKKGLPLTLESAMQNVNDIAGVRVVCSYIDDVYRVAEMVERQQDLEIVKRQDYIKTPNYNGYRSLHLDLRVPVYLSNRTEQVLAEVQIRTIAMDFIWARHPLRPTATRLPAGTRKCSPAGRSRRSRCRTCISASRPPRPFLKNPSHQLLNTGDEYHGKNNEVYRNAD